MTKTEMSKPSARPYTAPRLIRPDGMGLSPEAKADFASLELLADYGPS
ncbi:hypothetical protein [Erythrobacter sp. CCH5-A1]|jgi:hypothetical protein|nr:hypothetical protein [Erythrobacter sp. CCH5-A1]